MEDDGRTGPYRECERHGKQGNGITLDDASNQSRHSEVGSCDEAARAATCFSLILDLVEEGGDR